MRKSCGPYKLTFTDISKGDFQKYVSSGSITGLETWIPKLTLLEDSVNWVYTIVFPNSLMLISKLPF